MKSYEASSRLSAPSQPPRLSDTSAGGPGGGQGAHARLVGCLLRVECSSGAAAAAQRHLCRRPRGRRRVHMRGWLVGWLFAQSGAQLRRSRRGSATPLQATPLQGRRGEARLPRALPRGARAARQQAQLRTQPARPPHAAAPRSSAFQGVGTRARLLSPPTLNSSTANTRSRSLSCTATLTGVGHQRPVAAGHHLLDGHRAQPVRLPLPLELGVLQRGRWGDFQGQSMVSKGSPVHGRGRSSAGADRCSPRTPIGSGAAQAAWGVPPGRRLCAAAPSA